MAKVYEIMVSQLNVNQVTDPKHTARVALIGYEDHQAVSREVFWANDEQQNYLSHKYHGVALTPTTWFSDVPTLDPQEIRDYFKEQNEKDSEAHLPS